MTEGIIERNESGENQIVNIGENLPISMKVVQSIYNEITGKTETQSKVLREHHELTMADLNQLNCKITQLYEQYNVVSSNCAVTVYHVDDCNEQFSSFERFEIYDASNTNPCENVRLEYNFLIVLPGTQKAQPYKITIDLHSRTALRKKALREHGLARRIINIVATQTGNIEVDYVDYTVARNFMVAIDQWYKGVKQNKSSKYIELLQDKSEHFPWLFKVFTSIFVLIAILLNSEFLLGPEPNIVGLFKVGLISFGAVYLSGLLALKLGSICERAVDSHQAISGLQLNRGDEQAFSEFEKANSESLKAALYSSGLVIALNVFSAYISATLGIGS